MLTQKKLNSKMRKKGTRIKKMRKRMDERFYTTKIPREEGVDDFNRFIGENRGKNERSRKHN